MKGTVPDLHERGRIREVEARKLGAAEGVGADRRELGGDHDSAPELSVIEGPLPDLHERGRLRQVKAR